MIDGQPHRWVTKWASSTWTCSRCKKQWQDHSGARKAPPSAQVCPATVRR